RSSIAVFRRISASRRNTSSRSNFSRSCLAVARRRAGAVCCFARSASTPIAFVNDSCRPCRAFSESLLKSLSLSEVAVPSVAVFKSAATRAFAVVNIWVRRVSGSNEGARMLHSARVSSQTVQLLQLAELLLPGLRAALVLFLELSEFFRAQIQLLKFPIP